MKNFLLEVAANSVASAIAAQAGGAQRVELVSALEVGGITPSRAVIALTREKLDIDVYPIIRPRGGDCVYTDIEFEVMRQDIETCRELGCNGVVIGALTPQGDVDIKRCQTMLADAAGDMGVTFHRAFDLARRPDKALGDIITLGCERILTSGGQANAMEGTMLIKQIIQQADERIVIMPGAGVTATNVAVLAKQTGAIEFHASAKQALQSRFECDGIAGMTAGEERTDVEEVKRLIAALRESHVS